MSDTSTGTDGSVFNTGTTAVDTTGLGGLSSLVSGLSGGGATTSPFDFSGSVFGGGGSAFSPWDPSTYAAAMYSGADQYGQTTPQIQSGDPGSQLQQSTQTNQPATTSPSQPQQYQQQQQPGSLLAAARQMGQPGWNPYALGGGGGVPNQPTPFGPVRAIPGMVPQGAVPVAQPGTPAQPAPAPAAAPATAPAPSETPPAATVGRGGGGAVPAAPAADAASEAEQAAPSPAGQQAAQMPPQVQQIVGYFLQSPIGQLINQLTGGQLSQMLQQPQGLAALQQQYGNQVPRGYTAQNMPPWATPEQYQQYQRTGQMPSQTARGGQGGQQTGQGGLTQRPPGTINGQPVSTPYATSPNVWSVGATHVPNVIGAPSGTPVTVAGQGELTGTVDQSQIPKPSPDVQRAIAQADTAPYPTNTIQGRQANVMATGGPGYTDAQGNRRSGMSPNAIAGVFANIRDESGFNPNIRVPDQPRYGGEARYAHGLYQEGGPDWPLFQQFLNGRDWRDPTLQTQFMMQHFAQRNPRAWNAMNNAQSPGHAAQIFVQNYLIPARRYMVQRSIRYGRGVPSVNQQVAGGRGGAQGLMQAIDERNESPEAAAVADAAYAKRRFADAYPGFRRSPDIEDRRNETEMGRQLGLDDLNFRAAIARPWARSSPNDVMGLAMGGADLQRMIEERRRRLLDPDN